MKKKWNPFRRRKHIPYGSKGHCGYGGETYSKRYGEFIVDVVDKKSYRQRIKQMLKKITIYDE